MKKSPVLEAIKVLKKSVEKEFNKPCSEIAIGCAVCQAYRLLDYLDWYEILWLD